MQRIYQAILNFVRLLGRYATFAFVLSMIAGLLLSLVEAAFAVAFGVVLKLLGATSVETVFDLQLTALGENRWMIITVLPVLAIFRGVLFWTIENGTAISEEIARGRLRQVSMYRLLFSEGDRYLSASDENTLNSSVFSSATQFIASLGYFIPHALTASGLLIGMIYLMPYQSVFALLGMGVTGLVFTIISKRVHKIMSHQIELSSVLASTTSRIAHNWLLIRTSKLQQKELASISKANGSAVKKIVSARKMSIAVTLLPTVIGTLLITILLGFQLQKPASADSVKFISLVYLLMRLVEALSRTSRSLSQLIPLVVFYNRAVDFFFESDKTERRAALLPFNNGMAAANGRGTAGEKFGNAIAKVPPSIEVNNLHYAFKSTGRELYRGLNVTIAGGEQLGIVGPSGSGKSTLLCVILGITQPSEGRILLDGRPTEKLMDELGVRLGFVSAEPFLFAGTVKENLDYGQLYPYEPDDYRKVLSATKLLYPEDDVDEILSRFIREDMNGMSMGEKQRLCLARALLRKPNLIILDEVTANLDLRTELEIVEVLNRLKGTATIILVSHRVSALTHADRILDLETGETITYQDLKIRSSAA